MRFGFIEVTSIIAAWGVVSVGACSPNTNAADPSGAASHAGPEAKSDRSCDRGTSLTIAQAAEWEGKWKKVEEARKDPTSAGAGSQACATAKEFVGSCSSWSADVSSAYGELCRAATAKASAAPLSAEPQRAGCPSGMVGNVAAGKVIRPNIDALLRVDLALSSLKDLGAARSAIGRVKSLMHLYHCYDEDSAKALDARADKWTAETEKAIDEEEKCRAIPACLTKRRATSSPQTTGDRCGACASARTTCHANLQAGRFPDGAICDSVEGAKQCCDMEFIQCSNGQCGRVTR